MNEIKSVRSADIGSSGIAARLFTLVTDGQASSRAELAEYLGLAPSTISAAVAQLIERGLLAEEGVESSNGGRPRKVLRPGAQDGFAVAAELGGHHARIGVVRNGGERESVSTVGFDITTGPEDGMAQLAEQLRPLIHHTSGTLRAVGVALPGPVDVATGVADRPSRMPGWNQFLVRDRLRDDLGVFAWVDNDANAMSIGEGAVRQAGHQNMIMVKAGTAVGAGILIDGDPYRGGTGAAGDISHVRLEAAGDRPCSCGNTGCLETVASGAALQQSLTEAGEPVDSTADVARLAENGHPQATTAVRRAGGLLGQVLSANVNFFNPDLVVLGGALSTLEPFVAAVRSKLYDDCHPIVTHQLIVESAVAGADAGLVGVGVTALQQALAATLQEIIPVTAAPAARKRQLRV